jgi:hypothetical protein
VNVFASNGDSEETKTEGFVRSERREKEERGKKEDNNVVSL